MIIVADRSVIGLLRMRKRELGAQLEHACFGLCTMAAVPLTPSPHLNPIDCPRPKPKTGLMTCWSRRV